MLEINTTLTNRIFEYFSKICSIPHGSGNMTKISEYLINFAMRHDLEYYTDDADNVIIYKQASYGNEEKQPIILQGHLDMVCQKDSNSNVDFNRDAIDMYIDGDFIKAKGTSLGADNGIAVAMILSILEDKELSHPPIEAVFTTDEEIGMVGAGKLNTSVLKGRQLINLDAEEDDTVTVSCAGGSDFKATFPIKHSEMKGERILLTVDGLKGGHSGVQINGRLNSSIILGRILAHISSLTEFGIISLNGGDKGNAITNCTSAELCVKDFDEFSNILLEYINVLTNELVLREPDINIFFKSLSNNLCETNMVFDDKNQEDIIFALSCVPYGVIEMSVAIKDLVETSINLGILQTNESEVFMHFTLRSNKNSSLKALEEKMKIMFSKTDAKIDAFGYYPPWEYNEESKLRKLYLDAYKSICNSYPKIEAIHAGLECGVFASKIDNLDCIAIGPQIYDVHTAKEKLSISSTEKIYCVLIKLLESL